MKQHSSVVTTLALVLLSIGAGPALAQTAKDLVGTWVPTSISNTRPDGTKIQPYGPNPKGVLMFDSNGRFSFLLSRPERPKFAANNRTQGTPEENKTTVAGSIAYTGTYGVTDGGKTLIFQIEASTYPNAEGAQQKRSFTITGDELKYTNQMTTTGNQAETVWKRVK